jgi:hypothetical protein
MDQADVLEDTQVLRDGGLFEAEGVHDITDGALTEGEKGEDVPATGLGNGVESVGRGGGTRHGKKIHSHMGICQAEFFKKGALLGSFPSPGRKRHAGLCCINYSSKYRVFLYSIPLI